MRYADRGAMRDRCHRILRMACKLPNTIPESRRIRGDVCRRRTPSEWGETDDRSCSRGTDSPPPRSCDQAPGPNFGPGVFCEERGAGRVLSPAAAEALDRYGGHCKVGPKPRGQPILRKDLGGGGQTARLDEGSVMSRILVLVVSDSQTEVRILSEIVREQSGGEAVVVGAAGRGEQALSRALALRPHVILVNVDPAKDGDLEIIPRLRGLFVDVGIIALSAQEDAGLGEDARIGGADRTVAQGRVSTALAAAIREAARLARTRQRMADQSTLEQTS